MAHELRPQEQAVTVYLALSGEAFGEEGERASMWGLEDRLIAAIEDRRVGEYDGNEFGRGEATFYMYGPDADAIFATVEPILRAFDLSPGSVAILRYGDADDETAPEAFVILA